MTADEDAVTITIDGRAYRVATTAVSGAEIRRIPHPPVPDDRDLWLVDEGGSDRFLSDSDEVALADGVRLITAPRSILAG